MVLVVPRTGNPDTWDENEKFRIAFSFIQEILRLVAR
jgi:hypothetical protein